MMIGNYAPVFSWDFNDTIYSWASKAISAANRRQESGGVDHVTADFNGVSFTVYADTDPVDVCVAYRAACRTPDLVDVDVREFVQRPATAKVTAITWGEVTGPNETCCYDHVRGATSIGHFLITWKSWKRYPAYDVEVSPFDDCWSERFDSLDEAKTGAQKYFDEKILSCLETKPLCDFVSDIIGHDEPQLERAEALIRRKEILGRQERG